MTLNTWAGTSASGQLWPTIDPATGAIPGAGVVTARVVEAIPAVSRAMGVIAGRMSQMPLTLWHGQDRITPTPPLLQRPDPTLDYATLINALCWDYWIHGNALLLETVHDEDTGLPLAATWLPAERVNTWLDPRTGQPNYEIAGRALNPQHIRHFKRRLDPWQPWRGIGVLEQHMRAWAKMSDQQAYESRLLQDSAVPSVAIIIGNPDLSKEEARAAKTNWLAKFGGPTREPAILPAGTEVKPLSWSPTDAQMIEAQKASRGDVADIFDLDRFYLGVVDGSFNYKTASSMGRALLQDTLAEHLRTFEDVLTAGWATPGNEIRFDTTRAIVDDPEATMAWLKPAYEVGLITTDEARERLGMPPLNDQQRADITARTQLHTTPQPAPGEQQGTPAGNNTRQRRR
ncbi:MAG: phage portal protein [Brooklawnia sp.]|jgi:HK97 family phage portal protein